MSTGSCHRICTHADIPVHWLGVLARGPIRRHVEVEEDALRLLGSDVDPNVGRVDIAVDHFSFQTGDQAYERKFSECDTCR
jgi:hypothetical protein